MAYVVLYHPAVQREDIPRIAPDQRSRVARAVEARLTTEPQRYGEPLRQTLKGYWKLRVGDYRVVFRVMGEAVWIYAITHRREVYRRVRPRLSGA